LSETCVNFGEVNIQQVKGKYYWVYIPRMIVENLGLGKGSKLKVSFIPEKREIVFKA
jgi:hypothetical protein